MSKEWLELARKNADIRRRIDKLNVRRAEVAANVEMTLERCAELEAENAELKSRLHGRREEIRYLRSKLSAVAEGNALCKAIRERDEMRQRVAELEKRSNRYEEDLRRILLRSDVHYHPDATPGNTRDTRVMVDLYALVMARETFTEFGK
jgi:seryl-tRNA synthetase